MKKVSLFVWLIALMLTGLARSSYASDSVTIHVKNAGDDMPVQLGIPFPKGTLYSPDHVRVLNDDGDEILSQSTQVTTWEPADPSIKWLWVFFFTDGSSEYTVEYGADVQKTVTIENPIMFKNNQRENGFAEINTGPMLLRVDKGGSGFIDKITLNTNGKGFTEDNVVVTGEEGRGSFLDYINDNGPDNSKAIVQQHYIEKGSGPLHAVLKVVGEYEYSNPEHENSPFVTYIHAYAGKSFVKVYHTITYTGTPDKSEPLNGRQHPEIATQTELLLDEAEMSKDEGLTQPYDMIKSMGLGLKYNLDENKTFRSELISGKWWENDGKSSDYETSITAQKELSVFQTGPDPTVSSPEPNSTDTERIDGFAASISADGKAVKESEKAAGWMSISDDKFGVSIGIRNMMEEYPNELVVDLESGDVYAYSWSPDEEPMSFERGNTRNDGGMVGNFAQGLTKTTETIFYFHEGSKSLKDIKETMKFVLDPPVAYANPAWYGDSGVYGYFADAENDYPKLERAMQYKFNYMLFNQNWEPWYGKFYYGDVKNYFFRDNWVQWANSEPAQDFMWWTNFTRTGDPRMYKMAQAASRHTMDVDNVHWPRETEYRGDSNSTLDWFLTEKNHQEGSPYVGMGRRHANEQWVAMLTAHVWITGWISSYYLDGYHRGLEVARLTGDYYIKRVFGEHGLRGRRLYLSIWNLTELYDATKEKKYLDELNYRVDHALDLGREQVGDRFVIDRYGYSQNYLSHGLTKYLQLFDRPDIKSAYLVHARSLRDVPPRDHDYESYLASIHPLITAYDFSGEESFLKEACSRATNLLVDKMDKPISDFDNQADLVKEMENISHLPSAGEGPSFRGRTPVWSFSMGLRIFGWTHAYSVPYMIDRLEGLDSTSGYQCAEK